MDLAVILLYFIATLVFAFHKGRKAKYKEYFFCRGKYSMISLTATIFATSVGAASIFYSAEMFYKEGIKFFFITFGDYTAQFLIAIFVVTKMSRWLGCLTPGEIIADLYSPRLKMICGIASVMVSVGFVAVQIYAFGYVIAFFYDVPKFYSIILGGLFTVLYTAYGGINSVIKTDIFQFCIIISSIFLLTKVGLNKVGGLDYLLSRQDLLRPSFSFSKQDLADFLKFSLVGFSPAFIQRVFIAKDVKQARDATIVYGLLGIMFFMLMGLCGIIAFCIFPGTDPKMSIVSLINYLAFPGMKGLLIAGFLSSIMSSADSDLNIASVSVYKDVLGLRISASGLSKMKQISSILGIIAIIIALNFDSIIEILFFVINFWSITFMFPLILGIMGLKFSYRDIIIVLCVSLFSTVIYELFAAESKPWLSSGLAGTLVNICMLLFLYFLKCGCVRRGINGAAHQSVYKN